MKDFFAGFSVLLSGIYLLVVWSIPLMIFVIQGDGSGGTVVSFVFGFLLLVGVVVFSPLSWFAMNHFKGAEKKLDQILFQVARVELIAWLLPIMGYVLLEPVAMLVYFLI